MIQPHLKHLYNKTIHHTDRFLHTDSSFLARGGLWSTLARVASSLLLFTLSFLYARYLTPELYGSYRYVFSILGMFGFLTFSDFLTSFARAAAQKGKEHLYRMEGKLYFLLSLPLALLGIGTGVYFLLQGNAILGTAFLIAGFFAPLREGITIFNAWLILNQKFREKAIIVVVENVSSLFLIALAIGAVVYYNLSALYALAFLLTAYSIGHGIPRLFYFFRIQKQIPKGPKEPLKQITRFGIHLSLSSILPTVAGYLDSVLVFSLLGAQALAVYSFAMLIPEQAKSLLGNISTIVQPKIFSKSNAVLSLLPRKLLRATLIVGVGVMVYIFIAPFIFDIFFPRYIDAVAFSQVFMFSTLAVPLAVLGSAVIATQNITHLYFYRTVGPIVQIALIIILIPMFGVWGAVWARVIGRIFKSSIMLFMFRGQAQSDSV